MADDKLILEDIDPSKIKVFSLKGEVHNCLVDEHDVYDGDTLKVVFIRNNEPMKMTVRMFGIDTPEMRPSRNNPTRRMEKQKAKEARDALKKVIANKKLRVKIHGEDKYGGRVVGTLYIVDDQEREISVNQWMIDNNYARAYAGGKKEPWVY